MKTKAGALIVVVCMILIAAVPATAGTGGGDLTFSPPNAKPVTFSHEEHVNVKELKCSACHNHTFQMGKNEDKMDMSKMTKGLFCGHCHNGTKAFDVKDKANCNRCHK